ncbi:MAG: glutamate--tRNA ligase family protein [Vicinamibacterales bacterium]
MLPPDVLVHLRSRLPAAPVTRFAPAPTGFLHLGHVVNAIHVWGVARALGGRVLLRVEDHDRQRCRPEYEAALLDDLDWLGFAPDVYPTTAFRAGTCEGRQSDRDAHYRRAVEHLRTQSVVYGCACTRREIEAAGGGPMAEELRYPGTCRDRGLPLDDAHGWRVRLPDTLVTFDDARHGATTQTPAAQCGDLLLRDRLGNWTYQFAVTVDDIAHGIDLVVRGDDLFTSTGRQLQFARLLGRDTPPVFLHHALVMKSPTQKLSKSDGDTGVRDLRAAGWSAARVIGHAAHLAGLVASGHDIDAVDVGDLFRR